MDDIEDSRSAHSIGIVENPLYAEDEAGPTYSGLAAKEKESEVCRPQCIHYYYKFKIELLFLFRLRWGLLQRKARPFLSISVLLVLKRISNFCFDAQEVLETFRLSRKKKLHGFKATLTN